MTCLISRHLAPPNLWLLLGVAAISSSAVAKLGAPLIVADFVASIMELPDCAATDCPELPFGFGLSQNHWEVLVVVLALVGGAAICWWGIIGERSADRKGQSEATGDDAAHGDLVAAEVAHGTPTDATKAAEEAVVPEQRTTEVQAEAEAATREAAEGADLVCEALARCKRDLEASEAARVQAEAGKRLAEARADALHTVESKRSDAIDIHTHDSIATVRGAPDAKASDGNSMDTLHNTSLAGSALHDDAAGKHSVAAEHRDLQRVLAGDLDRERPKTRQLEQQIEQITAKLKASEETRQKLSSRKDRIELEKMCDKLRNAEAQVTSQVQHIDSAVVLWSLSTQL